MNWEWKPDYTALALSFGYVLAVILVGELLRRLGGRPPSFTRKFVHIGVGMWIIATALLFKTWYLAIIPPATFVLVNALSYWRGTIKAIESEERGNLGTVFFPISFIAVIYAFWGQPVLMVASLMPMTWGDAMAAIVGRSHGHYYYHIGGRTRSLEGSLAMLFWSWLTVFLALFLMPYATGRPPVNWLVALIQSGGVALGCTLVEALSPLGLDNLTVPAAAGLALFIIRR